MWQVLYLQMSSSVPGVSCQGLLYTQMGPAKKQEVIYFSRQVFLVHKTHGHFLRGIANGRKKAEDCLRKASAKSQYHHLLH